MENIFDIKNLNTFIGRYSRSKRRQSTEEKTGWEAYGLIHEKLPVLALRNRKADNDWPLSWKRDRNLQMAIDVTMSSLKGWQAFRPLTSDHIISSLSGKLPNLILKFQREMKKLQVSCIREIIRKDRSKYKDALTLAAKVVGEVSSFKAKQVPMVGSKILHFLLPEFFPVWDTAWIKNRGLDYEDLSDQALGKWLPEEVVKEFSRNRYDFDGASLLYASYLALMLKNYDATPKPVYRSIEQAYIKHSKVDEAVIRWHFHDTVPMLFEVCLLGKHDIV